MNRVDTLFDRMDRWRHLPNYQLERRADLFFSLYLPEVLEEALGFPISDDILPEFPIRVGTIYPPPNEAGHQIVNPRGTAGSDKSFKVDYLAQSKDRSTSILVELKTEPASLNLKQTEYLRAARSQGMDVLISGVLRIFSVSASKEKYFFLLRSLESMGYLRLPAELGALVNARKYEQARELSRTIEPIPSTQPPLIVYVTPKSEPITSAFSSLHEGESRILFDKFSEVVLRHDDPISRRFALSLQEWNTTEAGRPQPW